MKTKKDMKLSLNKVTISDLDADFMVAVRGGLADNKTTDPQVASIDYTNCLMCLTTTTCPGCSTATLYQTCDGPVVACAVNDDQFIDR